MKALVPCDACNARGVVPHVKRTITIDGVAHVDRWDFQIEEICEKCGGSGKMTAPPPPATG